MIRFDLSQNESPKFSRDKNRMEVIWSRFRPELRWNATAARSSIAIENWPTWNEPNLSGVAVTKAFSIVCVVSSRENRPKLCYEEGSFRGSGESSRLPKEFHTRFGDSASSINRGFAAVVARSESRYSLAPQYLQWTASLSCPSPMQSGQTWVVNAFFRG